MLAKPVEPIKQRNQKLIHSRKYLTSDSEQKLSAQRRDISAMDLPGVRTSHQTTESNASVKPNQERLQSSVLRKDNGAEDARVLSSMVSECSVEESQLLNLC